MKNQDKWQPSKYVYRNGKLTASRDPREVAFGSRLAADITASWYDRNLRRYAKGRLLDLGCGKVPLFAAYKHYVIDNICADWVNTAHKCEYLDCECDISIGLPFIDGEFDTIVLSDVLEHLPNPENVWRELSRLLAPGGRIIMNVPFYYWIHEAPHDYYRYTGFKLKNFVECSALKLVLLDSMGGAPEILADIFAKNMCAVPRIGRFMGLLVQRLTALFVRTGLGKKVSDATKTVFPFGYFLVAEKPACDV